MFDKTGTLTRGQPEVVAVAAAEGIDEAELLRGWSPPAERDSEHPLAQAIVNAARARHLDPPRRRRSRRSRATASLATVDGKRVAIGNRRLLERDGVASTGSPSEPPSSPAKDGRPSRSRSTASRPG